VEFVRSLGWEMIIGVPLGLFLGGLTAMFLVGLIGYVGDLVIGWLERRKEA